MAKTPGKAIPVDRASFFEEFLPGEVPLSKATAGELLRRSMDLAQIAPWRYQLDSDLIFVGSPNSEILGICSILGALGQVFALHVHLDLDSFVVLQRMQNEELAPIEYLARQHMVWVEFVPASELRPPDRELLRAFGLKFAPGSLRPQFRVIRPHFHPWFITEQEGRILMECVGAVCSLEFGKKDLSSLWETERVFPLVEAVPFEGREPRDVTRVGAPASRYSVPQLLADEDGIRALLSHKPKRGGVLEIDVCHIPVKIGEARQRPAFLRLALAVESKTAFVYPPETAVGEATDSVLAADVISKALKAGAPIPNEIHIASPDLAYALSAVADHLGSKIHLVKELPALEFARKEIRKHFLR